MKYKSQYYSNACLHGLASPLQVALFPGAMLKDTVRSPPEGDEERSTQIWYGAERSCNEVPSLLLIITAEYLEHQE